LHDESYVAVSENIDNPKLKRKLGIFPERVLCNGHFTKDPLKEPGLHRSLEGLIHVIRGQCVMFDSDLAGLYGVPTKAVNQAVRRKKVVRSGWRKEWIKHDPDWAALRGLKEFVALVP